MSYFIGIDDLVSNALIEIMTKKDKRFISYSSIEKYGARVVQILNEKGEKAVLILSRENTAALFRDYSDFFVEKKQGEDLGILLKEDKSIEDLIVRFRGYLSLDVLLAFVDKRSVSILETCA